MALTSSVTTPDHRTSPEAYAVIDSIITSRLGQRATVTVNIYHDQAARQNGAIPFHVEVVEFYDHPNVAHWDKIEAARKKVERDTVAVEAEAAAVDPRNVKGRADLLSLAAKKIPEFEAARDELLGQDWRDRYPAFNDLFSVQKFDEKNPYTRFYEWAQAYHPFFAGWRSV